MENVILKDQFLYNFLFDKIKKSEINGDVKLSYITPLFSQFKFIEACYHDETRGISTIRKIDTEPGKIFQY